MDHEPPSSSAAARGLLKGFWIAFCIIAGALIAGSLVGFRLSNLWLGLGAAVPGGALGWLFGRYISPLDVFFPP